jgi:hypothetical protein
MGGGQAFCLLPSTAGSSSVEEALNTSNNSILLTGAEYPCCCSFSHHTVVEIAAKIHEPSVQFPQHNCRVLYPRVPSLSETEDRRTIATRWGTSHFLYYLPQDQIKKEVLYRRFSSFCK